MKVRILCASVVVAALSQGSTAQQAATGFAQGQAFGNGSNGIPRAGGTVNSGTGSQTVPSYSNSAPESSHYGGGRELIGTKGSEKIAACAVPQVRTREEQIECDAINYLNNQRRTNNFIINRNTDPVIVNSRPTISNPGTIPASGTSVCSNETTNIPGTHSIQTCEESTVLTTLTCKRFLVPQCGFVGTPIRSFTTNKVGAVQTASLVPDAGQPGLYHFLIEVPFRACGTEGLGEITFTLDSINEGGFINIGIANLDDAAALAVNNSTAFAGHPNSGPHYNGAGIFPSTRQDFVAGYSWDEDVGQDICLRYVGESCAEWSWAPDVRRFFADTKLLDSCPEGYTPGSQKDLQVCPPQNENNCPGLQNFTPSAISGFFCNAEGKFLMNRQEGIGTWNGTVSAMAQLKPGENKLAVYWGTAPNGGACGNVRVSGQIYNVAPGCGHTWNDECADARNALPRD